MCNLCEIKDSRFPGGLAEHTSMNDKAVKKSVLVRYVRGLSTGKYSLHEAAESTGYSVSYLCRLKKAYLEQGDSVFIHKNSGKPARNRIPDEVRSRVAALYADRYRDVNFSFFQECLREEGFSLSYVTLRSILTEYGFKSPEARKSKKKKEIHRPRVRRECEGDLIQVDGTPFAWFYKFGDNKRYCMVGAIDDATSKITGLYMCENECLYSYLEILRQTSSRFGLPREVYSDRAAIFCVTHRGNKHRDLEDWEKLEQVHNKRTQWQRILSELYINQILAWSPQAKGRIERLWRTLQGQLPQWFYNRGISTIEAANAALDEYVTWFNKKYAVEPAVDDPFWIDAPANLDEILCAQFPRRMSLSGTVCFQGTEFYAPDLDATAINGCICISARGVFYRYLGVDYRLVPVDHVLQEVKGEMSASVAAIVHRYLFAYGKEISA